MRLPGRDRPPAEVAALRHGLPHGERVLEWAARAPAGSAVATDRSLHLGVGDESARTVVLAWEDIAHASWRDGLLTVRGMAEREQDEPAYAVRLADPRRLPAVVRDRVTASIVYSQHERLVPAVGGVRIVARRLGATGELRWTRTWDAALDPRDPVLAARAQVLLESARAGLTG